MIIQQGPALPGRMNSSCINSQDFARSWTLKSLKIYDSINFSQQTIFTPVQSCTYTHMFQRCEHSCAKLFVQAFVWPSPGQAWMAHIRSAWAALSSQAGNDRPFNWTIVSRGFWWSISIGQRGQSHRNWRCWGPHGSKRCTEVFFLTWHWMHLDSRLRLQLENIWKPEKCLRSGKIFTTKRFIALIKMAMACHSMDWSQWAPGPVLCPWNFHESSLDESRHKQTLFRNCWSSSVSGCARPRCRSSDAEVTTGEWRIPRVIAIPDTHIMHLQLIYTISHLHVSLHVHPVYIRIHACHNIYRYYIYIYILQFTLINTNVYRDVHVHLKFWHTVCLHK